VLSIEHKDKEWKSWQAASLSESSEHSSGTSYSFSEYSLKNTTLGFAQ
jgi:hypothetical protein